MIFGLELCWTQLEIARLTAQGPQHPRSVGHLIPSFYHAPTFGQTSWLRVQEKRVRLARRDSRQHVLWTCRRSDDGHQRCRLRRRIGRYSQ